MACQAVILAAGLGTRMRSPLAKVLHPLAGRPMICWIAVALEEACAEPIIVVHHQEEAVRAALPGRRFARQDFPRGTGDAVKAALSLLQASGPVIVCAGDTPLLTAESVKRLLREHDGGVTVAAFEVADPTGYGRILPGVGIVEEGECTPEQRAIRLVNSGLYVIDAAVLHRRLPFLDPHPPKAELYLTDLVGPDARVVAGFDPEEFLGVNDRAALAEARAILRRRIVRRHALAGVDFDDLDSVSIDAECTLEPDAHVGMGTVIEGASRVAGHVGPYCILRDTVVEKGGLVQAGTHCDGATVAGGASVGPMARLRPGTVVEPGAQVGNFAELKNTVVRRGAKAHHVGYLGDTDVGEGANIGAGTITCNYDGVSKHRTTIGPGAFVGSNSSLIAPIEIGAGAIVGAGTTIGEAVPADAIAVARAPLKVNPNSAERLRKQYRLMREEAQKA